uniref:Uncharacterized protein n=1 Tax=Nelumbo nucifera TaxID=4432 RepID=A0A822XX35_NELNU|nr:TPA_asm: hypothetical protein HUJ06_026351 [Nelumbo nucifera]
MVKDKRSDVQTGNKGRNPLTLFSFGYLEELYGRPQIVTIKSSV